LAILPNDQMIVNENNVRAKYGAVKYGVRLTDALPAGILSFLFPI
jgi:hypothetical protein